MLSTILELAGLLMVVAGVTFLGVLLGGLLAALGGGLVAAGAMTVVLGLALAPAPAQKRSKR